MTSALSRAQGAALALLAAWMGERYFRTFRASEQPSSFDALLMQRERRVGVTVGALWEGGEPSGAEPFEQLVTADVAADGDAHPYALWLPPGAELAGAEPALSQLRLLVARGLAGLELGDRRELRVPVTLRLAKVDANGAYMSVVGGLASEWTHLSEGAPGAFHLDSRPIHRLPEERAEREIVISRVRDKAALLAVGEYTNVDVHDSWLVSRLPPTAAPGLNIIGAPPDVDPDDGALLRRLLRAHVRRALEQRAGGSADLGVLLLLGALRHIEEERVTAALRGMSPTAYSGLDLIALVGDGHVRQILQPRSLPWQ